MEFQNKSKWRDHVTKVRGVLTEERRRNGSQKLCTLVQDELLEYRCIAGFVPFRSEPDITPLLTWIIDEKVLALPRLEGGRPSFRRVETLSCLEKHPLGFLQPPSSAPFVSDLEGILVPGLVFDKDGYRIGYGRGDYDTLLAEWPRAHTIGIGFSEQFVEKVPHEPHDRPVKRVIVG